MKELAILGGALGWACAGLLAVVMLLFPTTETVTITKKVETYKQWGVARTEHATINAKLGSTCDYYENRNGITEGNVPQKKTDRIVIDCYAYELEPGPVG